MESAQAVLRAEIDKTARKLDALKNALAALDSEEVGGNHHVSPTAPSVSPREFTGMTIAAAVAKLLGIVGHPMKFEDMLPLLIEGRAALSHDPSRHMRQLKTSVRMNSHAKHPLRYNEDVGTVSLRLWDHSGMRAKETA